MALDHIIDHTKPDITILCDICKCFLNISELSSHNTYHNALQLYKFKVRMSDHSSHCDRMNTDAGSSDDDRCIDQTP